MKKRALPALRPVICTLLLALPLALLVVWTVERVYGVPLAERSFRFERPLAVVLLGAALLVLLARGFLYRRRSLRLRVSRGADLKMLGSGPRVWLNAALTAMRVLCVALLALALMG